MQCSLQTRLINVNERGENVLSLAAVSLQGDPQHVYVKSLKALQSIIHL